MGQEKCVMRLQRTMALCALMLAVTCGCLSLTAQGASIDVVSNPELVKYCTLQGEGKYTAVGEKNALTLAKNAAAERDGNVLLTVSISKGNNFTTEVYGKSTRVRKNREYERQTLRCLPLRLFFHDGQFVGMAQGVALA